MVHLDRKYALDFLTLFGTKEEMEQMVKEFETSSQECAKEVKKTLSQQAGGIDFGAIRVAFHSFKGVARTVGAVHLFQDLGRLEGEAEKERSADSCTKGLDVIAAEVEAVAKELRATIASFSSS